LGFFAILAATPFGAAGVVAVGPGDVPVDGAVVPPVPELVVPPLTGVVDAELALVAVALPGLRPELLFDAFPLEGPLPGAPCPFPWLSPLPTIGGAPMVGGAELVEVPLGAGAWPPLGFGLWLALGALGPAECPERPWPVTGDVLIATIATAVARERTCFMVETSGPTISQDRCRCRSNT